MFMYRLEVELSDQKIAMVVIADSDEKAFDYVEASLDRHFIKKPTVIEAAILEKKRLEKGSAYIIESEMLA